ncbi:hypothetical protein ABFT80_27260 [Mesorhizobium sp. SB112]|uniref:hypothetical protein n=1 Tax=Mesorhizobium sp. SB112 TaxID=3151853 RepID=UPI0032634D60
MRKTAPSRFCFSRNGSRWQRFAAIAAGLLLLLGFTAFSRAQDEEQVPSLWIAGAYSFSDELGGFTIRSVSGTGRKNDPVIIVEEFASSSPITLVIRAIRPVRAFDNSGLYANGMIYMRIVTINGSGQPWMEFEFELQEILGVPSLFGDGLSFDQRSTDSKTSSADSFAEFSRDFEPYDRLLYRNGKVDPGESAGFSFLITDFTPNRQFYIVQDPRIPSS